jgi:hypothetical protein
MLIMSRTHHHRENDFGRPNGKFKKVQKKKRRAKERNAMNNEEFDNVPVFRKTDKYDYN